MGDRIDQISEAADKSTKYQPNIIVINAGTNDCMQNYEIATAGARYGAMLDKLFKEIPGVTIIVSTLLPGTVANRPSVNNQIRQLVSDRRYNKHQRVILADADMPAGFLTLDHITSDGIHPNDEGHRRLAAIFHRAIKEARSAGFLTAPKDTGMSDEPGAGGGSNTCDKVFGSGNSHGPVASQAGSGLDDGIYSYTGEPKGSFYYTMFNSNYTFARLTTPFGMHDIVLINYGYNGIYTPGAYVAMPAQGNGEWNYPTAFKLADKCIARGVRFADVNADGLDDMVCISPNGDAYVSINNGRYQFAGPKLWRSNVGAPQARVRLADIDGDGRVDYCTIADNGDISCSRNSVQTDLQNGWQDLGVVFTGNGMGDIDGVRFADINGDVSLTPPFPSLLPGIMIAGLIGAPGPR